MVSEAIRFSSSLVASNLFLFAPAERLFDELELICDFNEIELGEADDDEGDNDTDNSSKHLNLY